MENDKLRQERRRRLAHERLGTTNPFCTVCGENDVRCLDRHHLSGHKFGDDLSIVCRNCHRKLSDMQKDHPRQIFLPPDKLERAGHLLLGLSDLLALLIERLKELGRFLIEHARTSVPTKEE